MNKKILHFDVSSGLKKVLGSELITDDEVAIFELVKNSFDADATEVNIFFGEDQVVISDNGTGMSYEDIRNKWLFVAYSSKRAANKSNDFRDNIAKKKHYAGSKGIGRFSSDRLGKIIILQTRPESNKSGPIHEVTVDWSQFDVDYKDHFENMEVAYTEKLSFVFPKELPALDCGTVITIKEIQGEWTREKILRIKSALAKLINPFGASSDEFRIVIHAPSEKAFDSLEESSTEEKGRETLPNKIVNGEVGNFIFSTLQEKTTFITVSQ